MGGVMALPEPFVWAWTQLVQFNAEALSQPGSYVHYDRSTVSLHDVARNNLVQRMRGDWLLMLDTDLTFDPDVCARLLRVMYRYDLDVVSGLYPYKSNPTIPVISMLNKENGRGTPVIDWDHNQELFEFDGGGGAGCLLVRKRVFERMKQELHCQPFERTNPIFGEDFSFYQRCRALGISCWCAWRVACGHLGYQAHMVPEQTLNRERYEFVERETVGIGQQIKKGA
jgi:hypothetical protein